MIVHINRDAVAGIVLAVLGAAIALYAYSHYPVGSISRMGPGMVPVMMGCTLIAVALAILVRALLQPGGEIEINVRAAIFVLSALAVFALLVDSFGIVPALLGLLLMSNLAASGTKPVRTIVSSLVVTAVIVVIFVYLMNLNFSLFRWPA